MPRALSKKYLQEIIDAEETQKEEELAIEQPVFDPVKKIASILSRKQVNIDFSRLKSETLLDNLVAYYLIEHLPAGKIDPHFMYSKTAKDKSIMKKLVMIDVSLEINTKSDYNSSNSLETLAFEVAGDIYHTLFTNPTEKNYVKSLKEKIKKITSGKIVPEDYQDKFSQFIPQDAYSSIAARAMMPLFEGVEQRLPYVNTVSELRYLVVIGIYKNVIKEKKSIESLDATLADSRYSTKDALIHTVLRIHKDFFDEIDS